MYMIICRLCTILYHQLSMFISFNKNQYKLYIETLIIIYRSSSINYISVRFIVTIQLLIIIKLIINNNTIV